MRSKLVANEIRAERGERLRRLLRSWVWPTVIACFFAANQMYWIWEVQERDQRLASATLRDAQSRVGWRDMVAARYAWEDRAMRAEALARLCMFVPESERRR